MSAALTQALAKRQDATAAGLESAILSAAHGLYRRVSQSWDAMRSRYEADYLTFEFAAPFDAGRAYDVAFAILRAQRCHGSELVWRDLLVAPMAAELAGFELMRVRMRFHTWGNP